MSKVKQAALKLAQENPDFREALLTQMRSKSASELTEGEWANVHKKMAKLMASALRDGTTHDYWASTASVPRDVGHGMYFQFGTQSFPKEVNAYISVFTPMFPKVPRAEWVGLYMDLADLLRKSKSLLSTLGQVKFTVADKATQLWVTLPADKRTSESEKVLLRATQQIAKMALNEIRAARSIQKTSAKTAASARLLPSLKREINKQLIREGFGGRGRWRKPEQGYAKALEVLSNFGIELDTVVSSHLFNRPQGSVVVDLAFTNEEDSFSPESISNSVLRLDWTDVGNGYEIIGYMS